MCEIKYMFYLTCLGAWAACMADLCRFFCSLHCECSDYELDYHAHSHVF